MKKLIPRLLLLLIPIAFYYYIVYFTDPFNVFHYDNVRETGAANNSNYIKTRYVVENPDKYNAFVVGSSRVANMPESNLPKKIGEIPLKWYNLETAMASVKDGEEAIKTLLENGVDVRYIVLGIDEVSMWRTYEQSCSELMSMPYQKYEENPVKFLYQYLKVKPKVEQLVKVLNQSEYDMENTMLFYEYGVQIPNLDTSMPKECGQPLNNSLGCEEYISSDISKECIVAITDIIEMCRENNIELVVYTSPIQGSTYKEATEKGYFDFLVDVSKVTNFYNFSGLNKYTTDQAYYFDNSHFRPCVGLEMEKVMFSSNMTSDVSSFGAYITTENAGELVQYLMGQLQNN